MTPQELRGSILSLAIQGKLTQRLPADGDAKSLLLDSAVEDNVDGQRVKEKRVTEITNDEKAFDIPDTWEWIKLGNVCVIARGGSPRPIKDYITTAEDGINWIKIGDTEKNGKYISTTAEKIKPSGVSKSRMVHAGDFLLTNSMSFGRPYILKVDGCIHDGWLVISQSTEIFDQDYLYWLLSSNYAYMQFCGKVSGAVVKNLNSDKVANSVFPLPPLAEQKRIVAKIEELLPYIDRYEQAWSKLEDFNKRFPVDMQKSILQMAIQGKLVEQRPEEGTGEELYQQIQAEKKRLIKAGEIKKEKPLPEIAEEVIPFEIPESWKWVRLRSLGVFSSGKTPTMGVSENWDNGTVSWITSKDMKRKYLNSSEMLITEKAASEMKMYPANTILMVVRSGILKRILPVAILSAESTINQDIKAMSLHMPIIAEYVYVILKGMETHILKEYRKQVTTVDSLRFEDFQNMPVPLPPLAEQKRIVAKLEEILPLCERLK